MQFIRLNDGLADDCMHGAMPDWVRVPPRRNGGGLGVVGYLSLCVVQSHLYASDDDTLCTHYPVHLLLNV